MEKEIKVEKRINHAYFIQSHCIHVLVDAYIPVREKFANRLPNEKEEKFLKIVADQCNYSVGQCVEAYNKSPLSERFIRSQDFIITNYLPQDVYGFYNSNDDTIYFEPDAIRGMRGFPGQFLFGHQLGCKIQSYKDVEPCYDIIRRECGIYDEGVQRTVLSGIFGFLALTEYKSDEFPMEQVVQTKGLSDIFDSLVPDEYKTDGYPMKEGVQKCLAYEALRSVYRV